MKNVLKKREQDQRLTISESSFLPMVEFTIFVKISVFSDFLALLQIHNPFFKNGSVGVKITAVPAYYSSVLIVFTYLIYLIHI